MYKFWLTGLLILWVEYLLIICRNHDRPVGSHPDLVLQVFLQAPFCFRNYKPADCQLVSLI